MHRTHGDQMVGCPSLVIFKLLLRNSTSQMQMEVTIFVIEKLMYKVDVSTDTKSRHPIEQKIVLISKLDKTMKFAADVENFYRVTSYVYKSFPFILML